MASESKIIGIDLGTTNSVGAIVLGTEPEVIPNSEGNNKTPSVVAFLENGDVVVGEIARRQAATNPLRTISSVKRLMGRSFDDIEDSGEVFPFQLVSHDGDLLIDIDGMGYRPEQISAMVLKKIKEGAEAYLNEEVRKAVITVPAYFDDLQRQATMEAAEMAGLEVLRLLNEPTAAAMAYGMGRSGGDNEETVAVYDFGGGTFDISILEITGKTFEVLTSMGDSRLGGDDLDNALVRLVVDEFVDEHGVDLTKDPVTLRRLKEVAERAKCELSATTQSVMALPFIAYRDGQPLHLDRVVQRDEFEELIEDFVRRTIRCCKKALEDANLAKRDIDKVILVGGTTRIPLVQEAVEEFFDKDAFRGVNPDEVVALGAATQAGVFEGNVQEVVLLDVTPHALGIEVEGGRFSEIISKNSTIPIKAAKTFTTTEDNQEFVNIHVLQGEGGEAAEARSLGKFTMNGVAPSTAGVPRIRVTFFINADGVMEISAEDMNTGKAQAITIVHSNLSEDEKKSRARKRVRTKGRKGGAASPSSGRRSAGGTGAGPRRSDGGVSSLGPATSQPDFAPTAPPTGGRPMRSGPPSAVAAPPSAPPRSGAGKSDSSSGITPAAPPPSFALLGDTRPGEGVGVGVRARGHAHGGMEPVDYSKAPPMYSHMAAEPPEPLQPRSRGSLGPGDTQRMPDTPPPLPPGRVPVSPRFDETGQPPRGGEFGSLHTQQMDMSDPNVMPTPMDYMQPTVEESMASLQMPVELPELVMAAVEQARGSGEGTKAYHLYTKGLELLSAAEFKGIEAIELLEARALLHAMLGQQEETRAVLDTLRRRHADRHPAVVRLIHEKAYERFGGAPMLRELAAGRESLGDIEGACQDLEQAMRQDPQESDRAGLERLYRKRLSQADDPAVQFKLVKLLLKGSRVDEAIEVLTDLQRHKSFETRALKILGLCHWQKNMHYLAWQKFRSLPIDDDMKDILYRLACDMETSDQLANAVAVLEHLVANDRAYRDADARLRKLSYRLKLQREEQEASRDVPVLSKDSRFVILEEINRGSMGIIFKAQDKTLNEIVALKVLNDYLCSDPSAVERFKSEARAAKKLSHPYIVRIHDLFELDGKRFLSMEYIEGTDLKRLLSERTTFSEEMILYYFMQICDALSYAHKLGIVHRDIKPANIMITNRNMVKITDFGIAKILRGEESTKSGTAVIGTPLYMAPEQIIGDPVDGRTDIYSLGIMMYEMMSGNPPFYLGNIEYHHIHTAPPPLPERVSPRMRDVILKMIAKTPGDRFQSIDDIIKAVKSGA